MNPALPVLALLCNALVWGVSWWPFRELQAHGWHPLWSTAFIYLFSTVCVLCWRPGAWRGFVTHPVLWWLVLASGLTNVGFNWAVAIGDVVRVVLLFYLMPAWSVLLAWPLLGVRPGLTALVRLALAIAGVAIVLKADGVPWPVPESLADYLALLGGFSFALTNILLLKFRQVPAPSRMLAMFGGGTLLACGVALLGIVQGFAGAPVVLPSNAAGAALGLAAAFLVANMALQYGAARLAAHTTALVMLSEVLFATVSSVALGAAALDRRTLIGGALIILAATWSAWPSRRTGH